MPRFTSNGGSSTMVMELPSLTPSTNNSRPSSSKDRPYISETPRALSSTPPPPEGQLPAPSTAVPQLTRWNYPRINAWRVMATFWSFIVLGANDAAYGALIPYLERYYNVNYTVVSLLFLSPAAGYIASAITNNMVHTHFGQRGVAICMSMGHLIAYLIICLHPPFPVLVIACVLAGYGNGLGDSAWNAWIGDMANPNEILGFLHAFYGLGAAISPLLATALIDKAGWQWFQFYYLMVGAAALEVLVLTGTFWKADGPAFRAQHASIEAMTSGQSTPNANLTNDAVMATIPIVTTTTPVDTTPPSSRLNTQPWYIRLNPLMNPNSRTAEAVRHRVTIISSFYLLLYVGAEVSVGGWIVTFMLNVRSGTPFASGLTSTGFWLGITVGRLVLGFVTGRFFRTEKHAVAVYLVACVALQLLFWLIPQFVVSAVMVSLLGFFLGPMFPAAVVAITKLMPKRLHVASIGFAAALGASGACIFPFATGAIANARGVQVLQPIVLAMLVATLGLWMLIPKMPKQRMQ